MSGTIAYSDPNEDGEGSFFWPPSGLDMHLAFEFDTQAGTVSEAIDVDGCMPAICSGAVDCRTPQ